VLGAAVGDKPLDWSGPDHANLAVKVAGAAAAKAYVSWLQSGALPEGQDARFGGQSNVAQRVRSAMCAPLLGSDDVAQGVLWLASEGSKLVTGHALPVDAGWIAKRGG